MFSGIIKSVGTIASYDANNFRLAIASPLFVDDIVMGASIAIDGVCLTACARDAHVIGFDLGEETRKKTLLVDKKDGDAVNIEFSVRMGDSLDGHMVQGHVDGITTLLARDVIGDNIILRFALPRELAPYFVEKGSIAVNGVSLTINAIDDDSFSVCLVPFTVDNTSFKNSAVGDRVHLETDIIGRYLYRFASLPRVAKDNAL